MDIIKSENRIGRFTSSKAYLIAATGREKYGFSAAGMTYIKKKRAERFVGRSTDMGDFAKPFSWGKLMEQIVFMEKVENDYEMTSKETLVHPKYKFWSGSPDLIVPKKKKVSEIKCFYPDNYFAYSSCLMLQDIEKLKKDFPAEYWQIVSNAIILGYNYGEGIAFMPKKKHLIEVREMIDQTDFIVKVLKDFPSNYEFIWKNDIATLPWVSDEVPYPDMVRFEFYIPTDDIIYLTERMQQAEILLNEVA